MTSPHSIAEEDNCFRLKMQSWIRTISITSLATTWSSHLPCTLLYPLVIPLESTFHMIYINYMLQIIYKICPKYTFSSEI